MSFKRKYKFSIIDYLYYMGKDIWRIHPRWPTPLDAVVMSFVGTPLLFLMLFVTSSGLEAVLYMVCFLIGFASYEWLLKKYRFTSERERAYFRHYPQRKNYSQKWLFGFPLIMWIISIIIWGSIFFPVIDNSDKKLNPVHGIPGEKWDTIGMQQQEDLQVLYEVVGARRDKLDKNLLHAINRSEYGSRYGQPTHIMQVTEEDMGGEFRVGLLNHTSFDEIEGGKRKFIECTWIIGRDSKGAASGYLTCWYEQLEDSLTLCDSIKWENGWEF